MAKRLLGLTLLVTLALLTACGSDEPKNTSGKSSLSINGNPCTLIEGSTMGVWNGYRFAHIEFYTRNAGGESVLNELTWDTDRRPQVGDVISEKNLSVALGNVDVAGSPVSGTATVTAVDTEGQTITIVFDRLEIHRPDTGQSATDNGTLHSEFRF